MLLITRRLTSTVLAIGLLAIPAAPAAAVAAPMHHGAAVAKAVKKPAKIKGVASGRKVGRAGG